MGICFYGIFRLSEIPIEKRAKMDLTILEFFLIVICMSGAGFLTGYQIGHEKGFHEGFSRGMRRGKAIRNDA